MIATAHHFRIHPVKPFPSRTETLPILGRGEVHLWYSRTDLTETKIRECLASLSRVEKERAEEFHFEENRREFIVSRGLLRDLLGRYTDQLPNEIRIGSGEWGKPELPTKPAIRFNLAHSGVHVLIGVTRETEIGVDLEVQKFGCESLIDLIPSICTPKERDLIHTLSETKAEIALSRLWTAKEAYLKAVGTGLQINPDQIEVPADVLLGSDDPARVLRAVPAPVAGQFTLHPLPQCEELLGCSAAVVVNA